MQRYLHLFNRGVDKRKIFLSARDRERFTQAIRICQLTKSPQVSTFLRQLKMGIINLDDNLEKKWGPPLVEIIAYVLMSNHFHFEVKELVRHGVPKFIQRLDNSYTRYFNVKNKRTGRLFGSTYKSVEIETDEQLIHLSRYIHTNPANSSKTNLTPKQLKAFPWSSLPTYLGRKSLICQPKEVMTFFKSPGSYWDFVKAGIKKEELKLPSAVLID